MPTTPIDAIAELNTVLLREAEQRKIMIRPSDRPSAPN